MMVTPSQASDKFNVSTISLSTTGTSSNNQALYHYEEGSYALGQVTTYLSYVVAGVSLILFLVGYFGSKLQSL